MVRTVILLFCIFHGACATAAWRSSWSDHPISETRTLYALPDNARRDSSGIVFLRMLGIAPDDKSEYVCLEKPIASYPRAESGYAYVQAGIRPAKDCPAVENASQLLVAFDASQKLLLPDLGIAISIPMAQVAFPNYTGPSLKRRLSDVRKVERASSGEIILSDSSGAETTLKSACCLADEVTFFPGEDSVLGGRTPLDYETLPPGRVIVAVTPDRKRLAYFFPAEDRLPQFFLVQQELGQTNLSNLPVRGGLLVLLPVVIAVDIITAPIQILAIAIVANRAIEALEKFPRCLWPG